MEPMVLDTTIFKRKIQLKQLSGQTLSMTEQVQLEILEETITIDKSKMGSIQYGSFLVKIVILFYFIYISNM